MKKNKNINYNAIKNLNNIIESIDEEITNIKYKYDYGNNLNRLLYLYNEINGKNLEIQINYKPKKGNKRKVKIFDKHFIDNNLHKCKILYKNKEYDLTEYFEDIDYNYNNKDEFIIKLKGINNITNMSYIFSRCNSLFSLPDISKWGTSKVTNMSYVFNGCTSLLSLPDISNWNTSNVSDMSYMFSGCSSLSSLPDISKWNISKVTTIHSILSGCNSLIILPDISKWNTSNITNMYSVFEGCSSLVSLPDISKWNTSNVSVFGFMFSEFTSLKTLPDISKWNISNVINMSSMFEQCKKSLIIPIKFKR